MAKVVHHHQLKNLAQSINSTMDQFFYVQVDGLDDEEKVELWCQNNLSPNFKMAPTKARMLKQAGVPILSTVAGLQDYQVLITMDAKNGMIFKLTWM